MTELNTCLFVGSIFEFQRKIQEAKHCLIRQHTRTPGCVIGLPCGADVKSLTELHAAMTQITESVIEPEPQWQKRIKWGWQQPGLSK